MKTAAHTFSQSDRNYVRRLFCNPSYTERSRMYQLSWYFDYRANGKSPYQAYEEVITTLDEMKRPREEVFAR